MIAWADLTVLIINKYVIIRMCWLPFCCQKNTLLPIEITSYFNTTSFRNILRDDLPRFKTCQFIYFPVEQWMCICILDVQHLTCEPNNICLSDQFCSSIIFLVNTVVGIFFSIHSPIVQSIKLQQITSSFKNINLFFYYIIIIIF